jgi:hypothetical protein
MTDTIIFIAIALALGIPATFNLLPKGIQNAFWDKLLRKAWPLWESLYGFEQGLFKPLGRILFNPLVLAIVAIMSAAITHDIDPTILSLNNELEHPKGASITCTLAMISGVLALCMFILRVMGKKNFPVQNASS